jgi:hypothetical protein
MENLRKKNKTEFENKMEGQCRIEKAEDRISKLEEEMVNKEKPKSY